FPCSRHGYPPDLATFPTRRSSDLTTSTDREIINNVFRGHLENINRLVDEGKLIVAGPLGKNDHSYWGIFIFSVNDPEEVKQILQDRKSTRLNSSHVNISYAVFCLR